MRTTLLLLLLALSPAALAEAPPHLSGMEEVCRQIPLAKEIDPVLLLNQFMRDRATESVYYRGEPVDLCGNLAAEACREDEIPGTPGATLPIADTDFLRRTYERDRTLLRGFEQEWEERNEMGPKIKKENFVARRYAEHYEFTKRLDEAEENLVLTKKYLRNFLERRFPKDAEIQETLSLMDLAKLDRDYSDPDFVFGAGARVFGIRVFGYRGATVRFVRHRGPQIFFNSHELGHSLEKYNHARVKDIVKCLRQQVPAGKRYDASEIFGDWVAVQTLAEYLKANPQLSIGEKQQFIKSTARYFCGYGGTFLHPPGSYRIRFLESHPVIREALCGEKPLPNPIEQCE